MVGLGFEGADRKKGRIVRTADLVAASSAILRMPSIRLIVPASIDLATSTSSACLLIEYSVASMCFTTQGPALARRGDLTLSAARRLQEVGPSAFRLQLPVRPSLPRFVQALYVGPAGISRIGRLDGIVLPTTHGADLLHTSRRENAQAAAWAREETVCCYAQAHLFGLTLECIKTLRVDIQRYVNSQTLKRRHLLGAQPEAAVSLKKEPEEKLATLLRVLRCSCR